MTNERLEQIRDSVDFRLSAEKHLKVDKEVILEEKELLEYITFLQNECKSNGKIIKYLQNKINGAIQFIEKYVSYYDMEGDLRDRLLNILNGDSNE